MKRAGIITTLAMLVMALSASVALATITTTFNAAAAPTGTHVQTGTPSCSVNGLTVSCSTYELAGVGNTNATATLRVTYSATIVCRNGGGQLSDSQHQGSFSSSTSTPLLSPKNGRLTVPSLSVSAPSTASFLAQQSCPNPNWTPEISGSITLTSFTYTLHFAGFTGNYITITGP